MRGDGRRAILPVEPDVTAAGRFRTLGLSYFRTPLIYLYLAAGGILGTLARYGLGKWIPTFAGTDFPWHTFAINLTGSMILGFAMRASEPLALSPETRGFVTIGFCGAFTTFSTFSWETVVLIQDGQWGRAAAYSLGSVVAGLICVFIGMSLAGALFRPRLAG